jgi:hypothetical protein
MSLFSQDAVITSGGAGQKVNAHTLHCRFACYVYDGVIAAVSQPMVPGLEVRSPRGIVGRVGWHGRMDMPNMGE